MENQKTGFFEEKPGVKSSTRLFSFCLLIMFGLINSLYFWGQTQAEHLSPVDFNFIIFDIILLLGVFAPKYLHKVVEVQGFLDALNRKETEKGQ